MLPLFAASAETNQQGAGASHVPEPRNYNLTARELDCLRWTAEGKTSSEISAIIKLSEHTVNHYLISAGKKLNAVNRVQAVAKSLRLRIIL